MVSLLLAIIYLAFISLGLPDSLLGSAWPVMRAELSLPVSYSGIITMIISGGTIVSSLLSDRMTKKLGTGFVTSVSSASDRRGAFRVFRLTEYADAVPVCHSLRIGRRRCRCRAEQLRRAQFLIPPHELAPLLLGRGCGGKPVYNEFCPHLRRRLEKRLPVRICYTVRHNRRHLPQPSALEKARNRFCFSR